MTVLVLAVPPVRAEDTDIFSGTGGSGAAPGVLIVVDNGSSNDANFSYTCAANSALNGTTILGMVNCALWSAVNAVTTQPAVLNKLRMGLMVYGKNNNKGGLFYYPSSSPYDLVLLDPAGITGFTNLLSATPIKSEGNAKADGEFYDVWAWFTGHTNRNGDITYTSHMASGALSCAKSFVIFIGGSVKQGRPCTGSGCSSGSELGSAGATAAQQVQINTSNLGPYRDFETPLGSASWIDEWARFLHQTDFANDPDNPQSVTTYTIAIGTDEPNYNQTLQSTAIQGGGKAFVVTDINTFINDLLKIFNEIAATNTAFASSSLPVSANAQGTFLNQIFMGQFRPDANAGPRWAGNLKQYQFGVTGTAPNQTLFLADANGDPAISGAGTGFISANAESFWTKKDLLTLPDSIGGFWLNAPEGVAQGYDLPDGEFVYKGGVAQQLRLANLQDDYVANPTGPRNVYTCTTGCGNGSNLSSTPFATTNTAIDTTALGITNPTYTANVSSISRNSSTGIVTVTLGATPSPAITDPTQITISGSTGGQYDGSLATLSPATSGTSVTYNLPAQYPPIPPTVTTYKVTGPGAGSSDITSLTRNSDIGWFLGTALLSDPTFSGGSSVTAGDVITISNSIGGYYDGSNATVVSVSGGNTVTFRKSETPSPLGGGGKISNTNGSDSIASSAGSPPGVVRGTSCSGCSSNSGKVLMVTVSGGTKKLNPSSGPLANGTTVSLTGVSPSNYVLSNLTVIGTGTACSVQYTNSSGVLTTVTGTANTGSGQNTVITSICVDLGSGFTVFPSSVGSSAQSSPQTAATRQNPSQTRDITGWSVTTASNCPTTANETVQATTSIPHGFSSGSGFTISGTGVPATESALTGSKTITVTGINTFTYTVTTTPTCTDNASGMKITYQSSSGSTDPKDLIRWVRGFDNRGDEQSPGNGITIRPSVHGDVLHSRPTVVNYGTTGVVVFYGANDGTFRAINGNQPLGNGSPIGGALPGGEIWSFIPTEFFSKLQRLYNNSPQIKLANTPTGITPTPQPKDYFFDGSTGVYQNGSTVYIVLSGRRGVDANGKGVMYALDVSTPDIPKFLWKHVGGETGFEELGQAWSTPKVALVKGHVDGSGNPKPVVIFGGGYDTNQDSDPPGATNDSTGRAIFVLDAADGSIVWKAVYGSGGSAGACTTSGTTCTLSDMTYSVPADITLLNRDYDLTNYIDRLYAADIGGNIWRVDLEPAAGNTPDHWKVTKFASLGGTGSPKRKFFFPPDVVTTKTFDMVMAGTGDREHPLYSASSTSSYAVKNRFYGLKDPNVGNEVATGWTPILDDTSSTGTAVPTGLTHVIPPNTLYDPASSNNGFYIDMPNAGEKIVNAPTTIGGFTYFGSNTPPLPNSQACTNEGTARGYQVNFLTGATNSETLDSQGLPPSPVAGLVTIHMPDGSDQTFPFLLGANPDPGCVGPDCKSSFGGSRPPVPIPPTRKRVYWFVDKHDN